jgi:hypothetical protein
MVYFFEKHFGCNVRNVILDRLLEVIDAMTFIAISIYGHVHKYDDYYCVFITTYYITMLLITIYL